MRLSVLPMVRRLHRKHSTGSRPLMPPNSIVSRIRLAAWGTFIHSFTGSSHKRLYPYGSNIFTFWGRIITPRPYGIYKSKKYYGRAYSILFNYCLRPVLSSETAECSTTLAKKNYVGSCCSSQAGHTLTSGFASSTICFLSGEYIMCQLKRLISNTELQLHCVSNNIIFQVQ